MDVPSEWERQLCEWASKYRSIRELWIFGSRVKGTPEPDSDLDVGVYLVPKGWAMGTYTALSRKWEEELGAALGVTVHLGAVEPGTELDTEVRTTGKCLWVKDGQSQENEAPRPSG